MTLQNVARRTLQIAVILSTVMQGIAHAESAHGIAMYGDPALPPDFVSLPYANPDAPKGGRIVFGEPGGFDSLNPHILKGNYPWGVRAHVFESLMGRNWDEPFTLYGLLAESVDTGPNREWVSFTLRPEARFSDGTPVTVADVLWSFETLGTQGHPRYHGAWAKVAEARATGPRTVRFDFNEDDRELPLILGLGPILQKAQWEGKDFAQSGLTVPIGTSPYVINSFEPGRYLSLTRNPDYWGNDLPFNRGRNNLDEIRYEFFGDGDVVFESFRGGLVTSIRETNAAKWDTAYDFPAVANGQIVKSEIPHKRPSGMKGLVFNTRRPIFADWRVRDALIYAFNYEFVAATLTGSNDPRIASYFSNAPLGMRPGPADARVHALLAPFADELTPDALDAYALPVSNGRESNRKNLRIALAQLEAAGWAVADDGVLRDADGTAFTFEILINQGATEIGQIVDIYVEALKRLGITPTITAIDSAQFNERKSTFNFDMTYFRVDLSLSPGNEQTLYWGAASADAPGARNLMGVKSKAIDTMIHTMLSAKSQDDFVAATRALDRALTTGRYVIPFWYSSISRIAHSAQLKYPTTIPLYGDWIGFQPDVWWFEDTR